METKKIAVSPHGIEVYELSNDKGMRVQVLTYGARLFRLYVPNRQGEWVDVVAGYETPDEFEGPNPYFNAIIGRTLNRVGNSRFVLNGKEYWLNANDGAHSLHGGQMGFDRRRWQALFAGDGKLMLGYHSPDGEERYPGNLDVTVTYRVDNDNALHIDYAAVCDADTVCNLTNHAYFHLGGRFDTIRDHVVWVNADRAITVNDELIADGGILDVKGTPFDFGTPKALGRDIDEQHPLLKAGWGGYDIGYILRDGAPAATAYDPEGGIKMTVYTDRPCLQLYSGNMLDGSNVGKHVYRYQSAFCMETQGYPNACNVPDFPSNILRAGQWYRQHTAYRFSVE